MPRVVMLRLCYCNNTSLVLCRRMSNLKADLSRRLGGGDRDHLGTYKAVNAGEGGDDDDDDVEMGLMSGLPSGGMPPSLEWSE